MKKCYYFTECEYELIKLDIEVLLEECEKKNKADPKFLLDIARKVYIEFTDDINWSKMGQSDECIKKTRRNRDAIEKR